MCARVRQDRRPGQVRADPLTDVWLLSHSRCGWNATGHHRPPFLRRDGGASGSPDGHVPHRDHRRAGRETERPLPAPSLLDVAAFPNGNNQVNSDLNSEKHSRSGT